MNNREKLAACQSELHAPKGEKNTFGNYKYRTCEGILEALKPILKANDAVLTISDSIEAVEGRVYVKATVEFDSTKGNKNAPEGVQLREGDNEEPIIVTAFAREAPVKKGMDDAQITGAASSYSRKYALAGMFLLDGSQDDPDSKDNSPEKVTDENVDKMIEHAKANDIDALTSIQMLEKKYVVSAEQKKLIKDEVK